MSWKEKLIRKKQELKAQYERGKVVTEQMKAEKLRRKGQKLGSLKPGSIRRGLALKQHPTEFMKEHYEYRKQRRKEKQKE